ncbi:MAG TPA: hypothetical protein VLB82_08120 [Thermodesulfobacteriota bacterium]|nr:hypothetical protein [Thermodesulfobacteriota bacterium]
MTRSLTTAIKNELATNDLRPIHLITIGFGTPLNFTDCSFSLTSSVSGSSVTYTPSNFIMGISNFTEEVDITKTSLKLGFSGADTSLISVVLNENVVNDAVTIFRGFLDSSNAIIADPFLLYDGQIDTFEIQESNKESNLILNITSHWANFDKKNGRKTNNVSQQRFFSTDVGMEFSSQTVQDIKWGRP